MLNYARFSRHALILAGLVIGLAGCKQPQTGPQRTWSEKWTDAVAAFKTPQEWKPQPVTPVVEVAGAKPDQKMLAARVLEHEGDTGRAIAVYEEILQKDRHRGDVHRRLARLYDIQGQKDEALKHFKAAIKQNPKDMDLLCDFGYHYYLFDQLPEAEKTLRQAVEKQPTLARAHNNLALVLAKSGRHDEALTEFRSAGNDPGTAHINLAYALMWAERWTDAGQQISMARAIDPNSKAVELAQSRMGSIIAALQKREQSATVPAAYTEGARPPAAPPAPQRPPVQR